MLIVSRHAYSELRQHGEEKYPEESCGILVGHFGAESNLALRAIPCVNIRTNSPHNRYAIDPKELIRVQKDAREQGFEIVGFFHSHPDHPALWSSTDLEEAHWIGCSYAITSVVQARAADTRSFRLTGTWDGKLFHEEQIRQQD